MAHVTTWLTGIASKSLCGGEATVDVDRRMRFWCLMGVVGNRATLLTFWWRLNKQICDMERQMWWGPPRVVSSSRRGVQRRAWRAPLVCVCVSRGGDYEAACEMSISGGFTLLDGMWCCSGTSVMGSAWKCPTEFSAVCVPVSLSAWVTLWMEATCIWDCRLPMRQCLALASFV